MAAASQSAVGSIQAAATPWVSQRTKVIVAGVSACVFFGLGWQVRGAYEAHRVAALAHQQQKDEQRAKAWAATKRRAAAAGTVAALALTAIATVYIQYKRRYPVQVDYTSRRVQS